MNNVVKKTILNSLVMLMGALPGTFNATAALLDSQDSNSSSFENSLENENYYIASNNSVQQLFYVLGGVIHKPFIVSNEAAKKRVSGKFDLSKPQELLNNITSRTGLIWYDDGSSVYVYDARELQSRVVKLAFAPFDRLVNYLRSSGLYDERFPPRSDGHAGSFYVAGPPVYVDLVAAAARYLDSLSSRPGTGETTIRVIKLKNTFVNDRTYTQRDAPLMVPGVATVLNQLLNNANKGNSGRSDIAGARITVDNDTRHALEAASAKQTGDFPPLPSFDTAPQVNRRGSEDTGADKQISIVAYSDTNSLLIQGTERQVTFVEELVRAIDIPKQQIQLSLWILDISKDDVDELGIRWQGSAMMGGNGVTFNTSSLTPENSVHFLADVSALAQRGNARVVSRPEILTQENVPALFDNNSNFYARLVGERNSSLEKITYGTLISVLPRLAQQQQEIEMILNIQDGELPLNANGQMETVDSLPMVNNTQISTEARVPVGYSLLIGGYSRDQDQNHNVGIPLLRDIPLLGKLFDYSYVSHKKMVRLFLIQPRLLSNGETWQGIDNREPVLGRNRGGDTVTLQSTVSMLRQIMNKR